MYKKNEPIYVYYVALKRTTGLTDLELHVYDPNGNEIEDSPFEMSEIANAGGLYVANFTPDSEGYWRVRIVSLTNHDDISKVYIVGSTKLEDIKADTGEILEDLDSLSTVVSQIKDNTDSIKLKTDNLPDNTAEEFDTIKDKLDAIDEQINLGGYIL